MQLSPFSPRAAVLAAVVHLGGSDRYIHWGFIQLSLSNLIVIILMVVVFVLAIVLPFPHRTRGKQ